MRMPLAQACCEDGSTLVQLEVHGTHRRVPGAFEGEVDARTRRGSGGLSDLDSTVPAAAPAFPGAKAASITPAAMAAACATPAATVDFHVPLDEEMLDRLLHRRRARIRCLDPGVERLLERILVRPLRIARAVRVVRAIGSFIVGGERLLVRLLGGHGRDAAALEPRLLRPVMSHFVA